MKVDFPILFKVRDKGLLHHEATVQDTIIKKQYKARKTKQTNQKTPQKKPNRNTTNPQTSADPDGETFWQIWKIKVMIFVFQHIAGNVSQ